MADKLSKDEVAALIMGHLTQYSQRVAEVVDDYQAINGGDLEQSEKNGFAAACMNDVAALTSILTKFVHEAMVEGGVQIEPPPEVSTQADIIDLEQYRANGGLLN